MNVGQPDLQSLCASLKVEDLVSGEEYVELRATFTLEAVRSSVCLDKVVK